MGYSIETNKLYEVKATVVWSVVCVRCLPDQLTTDILQCAKLYHCEMHLHIKFVLSCVPTYSVLVPSCDVHLPLCAKKLSLIISKCQLLVKELNLSAV